jgi:F-type H+-transporting ATPase subunit epsilon
MFKLSVVTPERPYFEADCRSVVLPGSEGYLGVLTDHAPLLTALAPGRLKVVDAANQERVFAISGGFFEVSHNHATVLADAVEEPGQIDVERARQALERARERLREHAAGLDVVRAELAALRARNRLEIAEQHAATRR